MASPTKVLAVKTDNLRLRGRGGFLESRNLRLSQVRLCKKMNKMMGGGLQWRGSQLVTSPFPRCAHLITL